MNQRWGTGELTTRMRTTMERDSTPMQSSMAELTSKMQEIAYLILMRMFIGLQEITAIRIATKYPIPRRGSITMALELLTVDHRLVTICQQEIRTYAI